MKNFKRIISFIMAMIIFASFFCYSIGASGNPNYAFYDFSGNFVHARFSDTTAYAFVRIRDWAEEENTTDLLATTYANSEDYDDLINFHEAVAYVNLVVWLEDGSENRVSDVGYVYPDEVTIDAYVSGTECLNYDDHYSIEDFSSSHEVVIIFHEHSSYNPGVVVYTENDGPIIKISTSD